MDESTPEARGSKGGLARAKSLTAKQRSAIAQKGALAKWSPTLPRAIAEGGIEFLGRQFDCAVLDTRLRLLTQETFLTTLGRAPKAKGGQGSQRMIKEGGGLPPFMAAENLQPFISDELRQAATPVVFRTQRGNKKAYGYDARLLPMVCEVYLLARDAHLRALKEAQERRRRGEKNVEARAVLLPSQERLVHTCDLLMRTMAKEHIISLVDRATGYHEQAIREEMAKILEAYVAPHLLPWIPKFPHEFFRLVYRLYGWNYTPGSVKHPKYLARFITEFVYDQMPPGVLEELKTRIPMTEKGWRKTQLHRLLTDTGNEHLDRQITSTMTVLRLSDNDRELFRTLFYKAHPRPTKNMLRQPSTPKRLVVEVDDTANPQPSLFPLLDAPSASAERSGS